MLQLPFRTKTKSAPERLKADVCQQVSCKLSVSNSNCIPSSINDSFILHLERKALKPHTLKQSFSQCIYCTIKSMSFLYLVSTTKISLFTWWVSVFWGIIGSKQSTTVSSVHKCHLTYTEKTISESQNREMWCIEESAVVAFSPPSPNNASSFDRPPLRHDGDGQGSGAASQSSHGAAGPRVWGLHLCLEPCQWSAGIWVSIKLKPQFIFSNCEFECKVLSWNSRWSQDFYLNLI